MSKLLVVFGITGQQGGSVANFVLNSRHLQERFRIRGVTRDTASTKAQAFKDRGVELCKADWSSKDSLTSVLRDAHTAFLVTLPAGMNEDGQYREAVHGKLCVDAAISAGVENLIFSTLRNVIQISNGRYRKAHNFNAKAEVEDYVRGKPIRSAFYAPGRFMQNHIAPLTPKRLEPNGPYILSDTFPPQDEVIPMVDIVSDAGKLVGAILGNFDAFEGKVLAAADKLYSMEQIAAALSKSSGQRVEYKQLSEEAMRETLPPPMKEPFIESERFHKEFGFYGPDTAQQVSMTKELTGETLTSFDDFLKENKWVR